MSVGASAIAETGSHGFAAEPVARLSPSGFDPARVASVLGPAQRRVLLSLSEQWGKACDHQAAKRMWHGIRGRGGLRLNRFYYLIEHKHLTDNCWRLNDQGAAVRAELAAQAGEAGTAETTEIGSVHEHAVPQGCAQDTAQGQSHITKEGV
jgi:hypothetical protein